MITPDIIKKAQNLEEVIKSREKVEIGFLFMVGYNADYYDTIKQRDKENASNSRRVLVNCKNKYYK